MQHEWDDTRCNSSVSVTELGQPWANEWFSQKVIPHIPLEYHRVAPPQTDNTQRERGKGSVVTNVRCVFSILRPKKATGRLIAFSRSVKYYILYCILTPISVGCTDEEALPQLRQNWLERAWLYTLQPEQSNGRYIRKGNAGIGAGLEGSFFSFEETSLVVLNLRCEGEMEGRLQSEPMGGWLKELKAPCPSRHFSARRGNTRIPYS